MAHRQEEEVEGIGLPLALVKAPLQYRDGLGELSRAAQGNSQGVLIEVLVAFQLDRLAACGSACVVSRSSWAPSAAARPGCYGQPRRSGRSPFDQRLSLAQEALEFLVAGPLRLFHGRSEAGKSERGFLLVAELMVGHGQEGEVRRIGSKVAYRRLAT